MMSSSVPILLSVGVDDVGFSRPIANKRSAVLFVFRTIPRAAATGSRCFVLSYSRFSATFIDSRLLGFGPSPARRLNWLLWPLLTSCSSLLLRLPNSIYHRLQDLPWYSHAPSPRATASFTGNDSVQLQDVRLLCILVLVACLMGFLFVSSGICLHLPSDSTSRWTPLVFDYILPAVGRIRDFHPLERALAGRNRVGGCPRLGGNRPLTPPYVPFGIRRFPGNAPRVVLV
jgi:hypothetical protein